MGAMRRMCVLKVFLGVRAVTGAHAESCRFCNAKGVVEVDLGGGEKETSTCINCEGRGAITCTTCQGTGIQPRYLDRR